MQRKTGRNILTLVQGNFVNVDGIDPQIRLFYLGKEKEKDFFQATKISRRGFLAACSDAHGFIRFTLVKTKTFKNLQGKYHVEGKYFNSLRQVNGLPMTTKDFVMHLPNLVKDEEIIKLAKLHLANNEGAKFGPPEEGNKK